jgi:hypothetical protein
MSNPFDNFQLFIWAVGSHVATLAAGCIVTVMIGIFEKYVLKRPTSWKVDVGILLAFLFFACFQAWHDQYLKAIELQGKLDAKPAAPQIAFNVPAPPPPTVIVTGSPKHARVVYLSMIPTNSYPLLPFHEGQQIKINLAFTNQNDSQVLEPRSDGLIKVVPLEEYATVFRKNRKSLKPGVIYGTVNTGEFVHSTFDGPTLTQGDADDLTQGTKAICGIGLTVWRDETGTFETDFNQCIVREPNGVLAWMLGPENGKETKLSPTKKP